jgi:tetratricopeptide (TPR) repeat protein
LLAEVEATPGARAIQTYAICLPAMVRAALTVTSPELALRISDRVEPHNPLASHALITVRAAHAAARGEHEAAAEDYARAAERWHRFGVLPEHAYALLGQGRALIELGRATEAAQPLRQAGEIFHRLQAAPALTETDLLLQQTGLLSA